MILQLLCTLFHFSKGDEIVFGNSIQASTLIQDVSPHNFGYVLLTVYDICLSTTFNYHRKKNIEKSLLFGNYNVDQINTQVKTNVISISHQVKSLLNIIIAQWYLCAFPCGM